ncbi:superoxide dismutase [Chroococcidiopsis sp [FACHB-1243]]|uniref:superoxide dismutase n=1 Tax=Chroococcidiopsis sp. [FACHB-1243] TaxID=2692781 RepID=UPI001F551ED9|nr:superoxide dismutase [Chroococcidiopsis sp. [FACHB-1243]]
MSIKRRNFLFLLGATAGAYAVETYTSHNSAWAQTPSASGDFKLPPLPYDYKALEPHIDAQTMRIHHDRHHATYVKNLNAAIAKYPKFKGQTAEQLIQKLDSLPQDIRMTIRNNGGGHVNHSMFWEIMSPKGGGQPTGEIASVIKKNFGSFANFQQQFNQAGEKQFGSGWAWLVRTPDGKFQVTSSANQDSPLMEGNYPIMGNDVWEHAYYLKYRNRRAEYLKAWWNVVNWQEINQRLAMAAKAA